MVMMPSKEPSKYPEVAGVLMVVAALIAILFAISAIMGLGEVVEQVQPELPEELDTDFFETILNACFVLISVFGVVLLVGGFLAYNRKSWLMVMVCAIIGIFSIGFFLISSVLSIVALILIVMSKDEFQ